MTTLSSINTKQVSFGNVAAAANSYLALNWKVIPVEYKSKECHIKGWQSHTIEANDIPVTFIEPSNVGVLLGASKLTDVDVDSPFAVPFISWLPPTAARWGRKGNPNSHHLYVGERKSHSYKNSSGVIIEIRSHGCYAVMPPSIHPDNEAYAWELDGEPGAGGGLEDACKKIFIAATLLPFWKKGVRHELALGIAALLLNSGWAKEDVMDLVVTVAKTAGDDEIEDRKTAVDTTVDNLLAGMPVAGYSKLVDMLGEQNARAIGKLIGKEESVLNELASKATSSKAKRHVAQKILEDLTSRGVFLKTAQAAELMFFNSSERELYTLGSAEFRALCGELYGINGKEPVWAYIEEQLLQHCLRKGQLTELFRFARYQAKKLYIHAGGQRVFRLDGNSIEEIDNGDDGVLFYSDPTLTPIQPNYNFTGSPVSDTLVNAVNTADLGRLDLYHIFIYGLFFESLLPTKPIVLITGSKGSSKTSSSRALKRAFHGAASNVDSGMTSKEDAFWAGVCNNSLVCIDNVDTLVTWLADALAVVATGSTFKRRKLYETNTLVGYAVRCFVIVTSRNPQSFTRDDVVDRLLLVEVERRKSFIEESYLLAQIDASRNDIWGELLTNLNKMVAELKKPRDAKPLAYRLADWARLAISFAPILGITEVEKKLKSMETSKVEFALDDSPLVQALDEWLSVYPEEGFIASGDLFKSIVKLYESKCDKFSIKDAKVFGSQLKNLRSELGNRYQIEDKSGSSNKRLYRFRFKPDSALHPHENGDEKIDCFNLIE